VSSDFQLGDWIPLPDGPGDALAAAGSLAAAASNTRAVVWEGGRVIASVTLPASTAGVPRFVGDRLHYGPGWLEGGRWIALPTPPPTVYGAARTSAWSRDGSRVVLLVDGPWSPEGGGGSSLIVERSRDGRESVVAVDPGAAAVWALDSAIVAVGREMRVWDAMGERRVGPAHEGGGVASISCSGDERWLLTVGTDGGALLWKTATFAAPLRVPGSWLAAVLTPDGAWVLGIDLTGSLRAARWRDDGFATTGSLPASGLRSLAVSEEWIVGSFNEAPFHRAAPYRTDP
jgi:hypothetical protein